MARADMTSAVSSVQFFLTNFLLLILLLLTCSWYPPVLTLAYTSTMLLPALLAHLILTPTWSLTSHLLQILYLICPSACPTSNQSCAPASCLITCPQLHLLCTCLLTSLVILYLTIASAAPLTILLPVFLLAESTHHGLSQ